MVKFSFSALLRAVLNYNRKIEEINFDIFQRYEIVTKSAHFFGPHFFIPIGIRITYITSI